MCIHVLFSLMVLLLGMALGRTQEEGARFSCVSCVERMNSNGDSDGNGNGHGGALEKAQRMWPPKFSNMV
jgi:hypothetical protein